MTPKEKETKQKGSPCSEELMMAQRCMSNNGKNKERCELYFENQRQCQRFWNQVRVERFFQGKHPLMPTAAEREQMKAKLFG